MNGLPKTAHMKFICCPRRFIWSNRSSITGSRLDLNPRPYERQRRTLPQLSTLTVAPPRRLYKIDTYATPVYTYITICAHIYTHTQIHNVLSNSVTLTAGAR